MSNPLGIPSQSQLKQQALAGPGKPPAAAQSVLTPATPEQSAALRKGAVPRFFEGLGRGFTSGFQFQPEQDINRGFTGTAQERGESVGRGLGVPAGIAAITEGGKGVVNVLGKGARAADTALKGSRFGQFLTGTKTGIFLTKGTGAAAIAETLPRGVSLARQKFAPPEVKSLEDRGINLKKITGAGLESQGVQGQREGFLNVVKQELPLGKTLFTSKAGQEAFQAAARKEAARQGLTGAERETALREAVTRRNLQEGGLLGSFVGVGAQAEQAGRATVTKLLATKSQIPAKTVGRTLAGIGFKGVFGAGVIEGSASVRAEQVARGRPFSFKDISIGAGVGGLTAGSFSAAIAGTKFKAPLISKATSGIANILDPTEKPSDVVADLVGAGVRRQGFNIAVPTLNLPASFSKDVFTVTPSPGTPSQTKTKRGKGPAAIAQPPVINQPVSLEAILTPVSNVPVNVPSQPRPKRGGGGGVTPTPDVPVPVDPVIGDPTVPIPVPDVPVPADVPVTVPASTPVSAPVSIPVFSPQPRVPPPLPLDIPLFGGGRGARIGKRKRFVNELRESQKLLSASVLGDPASLFKSPKPVKKTKRKGKRKKRKKSLTPQFPVFKVKSPLRVLLG
jgi:hypothetical protein